MRDDQGDIPNLTQHLRQNFIFGGAGAAQTAGNRSVEQEWSFLLQQKLAEMNQQASDIEMQLAPGNQEES